MYTKRGRTSVSNKLVQNAYKNSKILVRHADCSQNKDNKQKNPRFARISIDNN